MTDPTNPEKISNRETVERQPEVKVEAVDQNYLQGAEILEEPQSGSFISTLQVFAAWVKNLLANDK
ncbi:MAG: hypothetical protein A3J07_03105 [Candidatus Doudnabacteria bacterium RIFCSPLOWO2_02_FULL_49_13]|uniref:Uncharacterized protein n=1 Tax=Candidatus Doudnabacteria bacterium RIFCSPHIGHO2_12_FULL_48_16 TaxID=1817838 RepID=A0A1F5PMD8_9BACT|nr:MAG: hypothetical protein A3B77_01910 [Candidatus Doudnabacteria bacterium RIFCSPHIGHO2_02_FULL_49_24]OGE89437.1 MAG: hypothetical protein A2760_02365 [Candidatus Doudnabacteria bacterium RIFCSPHIGHO2_01_FULL_50_67]OGE90832.1 MAG: hypothetical protein A3E29_01525 [Candidatus Doudnabacteria bacterium RIFCSPHIGHO2_12_FULL_48_16]OGE97543.1 MAG: hypothetical protein A2990_02385 [Candidatus Doudnabacteria bacterium RIFCSPLOWO2_01_FULL_49_40]OGF03053.1 MAG: hypothetical protein A3J07_03105 [Candid